MEIDYHLSQPQYVAPFVRRAHEEGLISDIPVCATCTMRWWVTDRTVGLMCICASGNHRTYPTLDLDGCEMWSLAQPEGDDLK